MYTYDLSNEDTSTNPANITCPMTTNRNSEKKVYPDLSHTTLTPEHKLYLVDLLNQYHDVFAYSPTELGRTSVVKHHIDTGNNPPVRQRPYRMPQIQREQIDKHIKDMLDHSGIY